MLKIYRFNVITVPHLEIVPFKAELFAVNSRVLPQWYVWLRQDVSPVETQVNYSYKNKKYFLQIISIWRKIDFKKKRYDFPTNDQIKR